MERAALLFLLASFLPGRSLAAPTIQVFGRTSIELAPISRSDRHLVISGTLFEPVQGQPVPAARVSVRLGAQFGEATTDTDGHFSVRLPATQTNSGLAVSFAGMGRFAPSKLELRQVAVDKRSLQLVLIAEPTAGGVLRVRLTATDERQLVAIAVPVFATRDEVAPIPVGTVITDEIAGGEILWEPPQRPGRYTLEARFPGDENYNAATTQVPVVLWRETKTTLRVARQTSGVGDSIELHGHLWDRDGNPLQQLVQVQSDRKPAIDLLTRPDGSFATVLPAKVLGIGAHSLQAVFDSPLPYTRSSQSPPVPVTVTAPATSATAATLVVAGITTALVALLAFLRRRPQAVEIVAPPAGRPRAGLQQSPQEPRIRLGRPKEHDFYGSVVDALSSEPVSDAAVRVVGSSGEVTCVTANGLFRFHNLSEGPWTVVVEHCHFVRLECQISVPHRGQLHGATLRLVSVREEIFRLYEPVAACYLPDPSLSGLWTPRQIFNHVKRRDSHPALAELTALVETSYFSRVRPDQAVLRDAREKTLAAADEVRT